MVARDWGQEEEMHYKGLLYLILVVVVTGLYEFVKIRILHLGGPGWLSR